MNYVLKSIIFIAIAFLLPFFSFSLHAQSTIKIQILNAIVKDQVVAGAQVTLQKMASSRLARPPIAKG